MKQRASNLLATLGLTRKLFSFGQTEDHQKEKTQDLNPTTRAELVKISDLKSVLTRLQNGQLEFDFFCIHSNGIDCIYFVSDGNRFSIDFEAMYEEQLPWIDKLRTFARQNGYMTSMTTYDNKPHFKSLEPAPVLRIETRSDLDQTAIIGQEIMAKVFGNDDQTNYEVVP